MSKSLKVPEYEEGKYEGNPVKYIEYKGTYRGFADIVDFVARTHTSYMPTIFAPDGYRSVTIFQMGKVLKLHPYSYLLRSSGDVFFVLSKQSFESLVLDKCGGKTKEYKTKMSYAKFLNLVLGLVTKEDFIKKMSGK